jgi:hypothetical protein
MRNGTYCNQLNDCQVAGASRRLYSPALAPAEVSSYQSTWLYDGHMFKSISVLSWAYATD